MAEDTLQVIIKEKEPQISTQTDEFTKKRNGKRILFVVNSDWFFVSHRMRLALNTKKMGYDVYVATGNTGKTKDIISNGLDYIDFPISTKGTNPLEEIPTFIRLHKLFNEVKPDLVHLSTPKVVAYGSIVARLRKELRVVNLISGLGYSFSNRPEAKWIGKIIRKLYRFGFKHKNSCTVFQNPDNMELFINENLVCGKSVALIRGSGVCLKEFAYVPEPDGIPVVMFAARMLYDKGVEEFVKMAEILQSKGVLARFVLVGDPDEGNPTSIPKSQLQEWDESEVIEWWGHRSDMSSALAESSIVVLPSYYQEGLPKVLIEAASVGRPIVASDIPGIREIVRPDKNGLLVEPRNLDSLVEAVGKLLSNRQLRNEYGKNGRLIVENEFEENIVFKSFLDIFDNLLGVRASA
jgi:glycosyltransferase involved in cell wall biosynthesis